MKSTPLLPDIPGVFCLFVFTCLILFGGGQALQDADTLWHIKAGQEMLAQGRILTTDIFSHTAFGQPWLAHEWLSEIIMAAIHHLAGLPGIVIFYFLLVAATFGILFKTAALKNDNEWLAIISVSVAFLLACTHLLARPHVFTWLFGTITLYILRRGRKRDFYLLPLLTIPWANLHGGFVLGLVLQGFFIVGAILDEWPRPFSLRALLLSARKRRFPAIILLLSVLAAGINPFGYGLFLFPFNVNQGVFSTGINEWRAPDLQELWFFRIYIITLLAVLLCRRRRVTATNAIFLLFFLNLSLTHVRYVSIAGMMLTPVLADLLKGYFPARKTNGNHLELSRTAGPFATVLLCIWALFFFSINSTGKTLSASFFPLPERFSRNAVDYILAHRPPGKMLNDYSLGGFLIYSLSSPNVFIDGRADMYGEQIFSDYGKLAKMEDGAEELLEKYQIGWVIFPKTASIIKELNLTDSWKKVYTDEHVSILVAKDEKKVAQK